MSIYIPPSPSNAKRSIPSSRLGTGSIRHIIPLQIVTSHHDQKGRLVEASEIFRLGLESTPGSD